MNVKNMKIALTNLDGAPVKFDASHPRPVPNLADDTGIMLFTSGTSGTKKLVPLSIHSMVAGVAMVVESWGLDTTMRCLNQMPLNHVGGLIRPHDQGGLRAASCREYPRQRRLARTNSAPAVMPPPGDIDRMIARASGAVKRSPRALELGPARHVAGDPSVI